VRFMTRAEIDAFPADAPLRPSESAMDRARIAVASAGCAPAGQQMGLRWPIGCVALEVTQRCNLDCSLCYLSENSEAVRDVPLEEIFRRVDLIFSHYGKHTDVQITGGDPTLRDRDELLATVARISSLGMRPTLMTNGIRAAARCSRSWRRKVSSTWYFTSTQRSSEKASPRNSRSIASVPSIWTARKGSDYR
jgi:7,8-dihydro-6-hydroxymethylpterin dimethyltransferase